VPSWDGLEILQEVERDIKSNSLENLEPEHMQVIAAAVISHCEVAAAAQEVRGVRRLLVVCRWWVGVRCTSVLDRAPVCVCGCVARPVRC
jgi:hypothetical protein